jgi:hypothetical protein
MIPVLEYVYLYIPLNTISHLIIHLIIFQRGLSGDGRISISLKNTDFVYINVWAHFIIQHINALKFLFDILFLGAFAKL